LRGEGVVTGLTAITPPYPSAFAFASRIVALAVEAFVVVVGNTMDALKAALLLLD
jgi:hypothetical protein